MNIFTRSKIKQACGSVLAIGALLLSTTSFAEAKVKLLEKALPPTVQESIDRLYDETRHSMDWAGISSIHVYKIESELGGKKLVRATIKQLVDQKLFERIDSFCDFSNSSPCVDRVLDTRGGGAYLERSQIVFGMVKDQPKLVQDTVQISDYIESQLSESSQEFFISTSGLNLDEDLHIFVDPKLKVVIVVESDIGA
jgi:hypothetical protein